MNELIKHCGEDLPWSLPDDSIWKYGVVCKHDDYIACKKRLEEYTSSSVSNARRDEREKIREWAKRIKTFNTFREGKYSMITMRTINFDKYVQALLQDEPK